MKTGKTINLSKERRAAMVAEIQYYYSHDREEEIGDLAAGLLLDFILENLAPDLYNQGIDDAYRYMKESAEDLLSIRA